MKIEVIDSRSPHLAAIKQLGKANSQTLGFLPEGGFDEYALRKQILAAIDENNNCVGYVLYRISERRVKIAHLCVEKQLRQNGVARRLIEQLKQNTRDLLGIALRCRRDYEASKVWSRFGFVAIGEIKGRGRDRKDLTCWWLSHGHPDLFSSTQQADSSEKLCVVIDANVFFDIDDQSRAGYIESNALRSDWLTDSLQLCLVDEIYTEINRHDDEQVRKESHCKAAGFTLLHCDSGKIDGILNRLFEIFPKPKNSLNQRDQSDLRQIAKSIGADAQYFVTRDELLLGASETVFGEFGLKILRPVDLIGRIDEIRHESEYQPARLSGTNLIIHLIKSDQEPDLTKIFQSFSLGETKSEFQNSLRRYLSNPATYQCFVVSDEGDKPLAVFVYDKESPDKLRIPVFRVKKSTISNTLTRHLILRFIFDATNENKGLTRITEKYFGLDVAQAFKEEGFIETSLGLTKTHLCEALPRRRFAQRISEIEGETQEETVFAAHLSSILSDEQKIVEPQTYADIEKIFQPAKILDAPLPCFIVPIRSEWALELFDKNLADQNLFGANSELALRKEQVYYRSPINSGGLKAPGRILWYVSKSGAGKHYIGSGAIRAYSTLDAVLVEHPKNLYRQFKRLGIYEWKHLYELAKDNIENKIMALRFSNTELFNQPIELQSLKKILGFHGGTTHLQSPIAVSSAVFSDIYGKGRATPK